MEEELEERWNHIFDKTESFIIKKAEEIIDSLTSEEKEKLEAEGMVLELEDVCNLILEILEKHFENRDFTVEHVKEDLNKLTKKDIFEL